jgi:glycosyltransferase involved in cell wall biosynthesis
VRITVFFQHYHTPDCSTAARPYALVERLAREHEVTVITTDAWRTRRVTHEFDWVPHDADFVELSVPYDNAMASGRRLRSFLQYAAQASAHALVRAKPDLIIGSSTPLTAAAAAGGVAQTRGVPWIFEVRDLWPDFPIQMGAVSSPIARRLLYGLEHLLYRSADHVVTASPDMTRHVQTVLPPDRVSTLSYGTDFELHARANTRKDVDLRRELGLPDAPIVLYAGSFGRANDIPTLLAAAQRLGDRDAVFVFAGNGYHAPAVDEAARKCSNVVRLPPQPYPRMLRIFRCAEVSVVSFIDLPVLGTNGPSKFYDSLGAGTPVVVTGNGWTRRFVEKQKCGWAAPAEAPGRLAETIAGILDRPEALHEAGRRARDAARTHFDRARDMDRYAALVADVGSRSDR